ncbi:hypothetical protein MUA02_01265 [Enterobacteriaceae bacterium H20N1]|uniref:Uncharacterized protein n=1 Tax=Dryocola boscaweniae TaxID=2925397 RepID=A0A9X3ALY5_9ENTR|nr:hypothetical protein [Dryocola boscaweniae]MCT4700537.1 hypothetical protein [Dryocola boscaweniae]MCT4717693.1 hypothetical protein [Dryocola boscaweniae]
MVNKFIKRLMMLVLVSYMPLSAAALTVGDISNSQQSTIMLKSALERAKLEKELSDMKDVKISASEVCTNKGVGMLTLKAVYGVKNLRYATFYYNPSAIIEARIGDNLLCGEKVMAIQLDNVKVEKDGVVYTITGSSRTVAKNQG